MEKTDPSRGKQTKSVSPVIYLLLLLLALFSALGLDYINREKGGKSYFFPSSEANKKVTSSREKLREIVLKSLSLHRIDPYTIQQYRDKKNILHLKIDIPLKKYVQLEESLEKKFNQASYSVLKKWEQQGEEKNFYLWQVGVKGKESLIILFSCYKEKEEILEKEKGLYQTQRKNKIAIIIDDMGYSISALKKITSLKKPLTVSILPFSPYAKETAQIAYENGLEVMLHLPLESVNNQEKENPEGLILSGMSEEEVKKTLEENLFQVPYVKGVNNHMGSKITADEILMRSILKHIKEMNLFFIDSLTTSKSVAFRVAQEMEIPSARRHIFLDSISDENYIKGKMIELYRQAQQKGKAVGICHPYDETLRVLKENIHLVEEYNLELVLASQIVR